MYKSKILQKVITIFMTLVIVLNIIPITNHNISLAANTITLTNHGTTTGAFGSPYFSGSDGYYVFCGHGWLNPPMGDNQSISISENQLQELTDTEMRKIAYYGYGGPERWSGLDNIETSTNRGEAPEGTNAYHATHWSFSNSYIRIDGKGGTPLWDHRVQPFMDYIRTMPNPPEGFKLYIWKNGSSIQDMLLYKNEVEVLESSFSILKSSTSKDLTELASLGYSIKGAIYGVYLTEIDAQLNRNQFTTLETKEDGSTEKVQLPKKKYFVKEIKAPKGFYLDPQSYEVDLTNGDFELKVKDTPKFDPLNMMLEKIGKKGERLEGAEFEVKFYNGKLTLDQTKQTQSLRRWLFRTNENGYIGLKDQYKIGGDDLFKVDGVPVGLIGTYTFKEIKAPNGYVLDDTVYIGYVEDNNKQVQPGENGTVYNRPVVTNDFQKGRINVRKLDETGKAVSGVVFDLINLDTNQTLGNYVTKEDGKFTINNLDLSVNYRLVETKVPTGYVLEKTPIDFKAESDKSGRELTKTYSLLSNGANATLIEDLITVTNKTQQMRFTLEKRNAFLIDKTKATLKGAEYDIKVVKLLFENETLKVGDIVKRIVADENGLAFSGDLPVGDYDLIEVKPSEGYNLNPVAVRVQGMFDGKGGVYTTKVVQTSQNEKALISQYNEKLEELRKIFEANNLEFKGNIITQKENPLEIKDNAKVIAGEGFKFGRITLTKHLDGNKGEENSQMSGQRDPEANIEFDIIEKSTQKVLETIKTNDKGLAMSHYLPAVLVTVVQKTIVDGVYKVEPFDVDLSKGSENFSEHFFVLENYTKLKRLQIVKIDKLTKNRIPQAGVTFELFDLDGNQIVQQLYYPSTQEIKQFVTDENGEVQLPDKIKIQDYILKEVKAPKGYYLDPNGAEIRISIKDDLSIVEVIEVENEPQQAVLILDKKAKVLTGTKLDEKTGITDLIFEERFLANTKWNLVAKEDIVSEDKVTIFHKKGDIIDTLITNDKTEVRTKNLHNGEYELIEAEVPKQYVLDPNRYEIIFSPQSQEIKVQSRTEVKFNERKDLSFTLEKRFETNDLFTYNPKAEFGLFLKEDYEENGVLIKKDTLLDKITVDVTKAELEEKTETKPKTEIVEKEVTRYDLLIFKEEVVDDLDKPILEEKEINTWNLSLKSYKDAQKQEEVETTLVFETEDLANEKAKELSENPNYISHEIKKETTIETIEKGFEQKTVNSLIETFRTNSKEELELKIAKAKEEGFVIKVDETKVLVKEKIQTTHDELQTVTFLKANGKFKNILIDGKFYVKELSVDNNYILSDEKIETGFNFEDSKDKNTEVKAVVIDNKLQRIKVKVFKFEMGSEKQIAVAGATFKLVAIKTDGTHSDLGQYITDHLGELNITNLAKGGNYFLEEVTAPQGYFVNPTKIEIDLTKDELKHGDELTFEIENEKIPNVKTTATDENGRKVVNPLKEVTIKDKANYYDTIPGASYTMVGVLMNKETKSPLLDENGNKITQTLDFVPDKRNGFVYLNFKLNASLLRGVTTVVFEDLYRNGKLVYSHSDINDKEQTVVILDPQIRTKFQTESGAKEVQIGEKLNFIDKVELLKDFVKGYTYTQRIKIWIREDQTYLKDKDGKDIEAIVTFTYNGQKEVSVQVIFDVTENLKGKHLVAFEWTEYEGQVVAEHTDPNDEGQTIKVLEPKHNNPPTGDNGVFISTISLLISALSLLFITKGKSKIKN